MTTTPFLSQLSSAPVGIQAVPVAIGAVIVTVAALSMMLVLIGTFLGERRMTGEPSLFSRLADGASSRTGVPVWTALPFAIMAGGLGLALIGWRAWSVGGPAIIGLDLAIVGLSICVLGGVLAGALAHPPQLTEDVPESIAHPVRAHLWHRWFGAGPIGAVLVIVGGLAALLATPVVAVWRVVSGGAPEMSVPAHTIVVIGVVLATVGTWMVHIEGTRAARREATPVEPRWIPGVVEALGGAMVLAAMSVALDSQTPVAVVGIIGLVALILVRLRATVGAAVLATAIYFFLRGTAAVLTLQFGEPVVPLWWQTILAAAAVEIVVGALLVAGSGLRKGSQIQGGT
jgi:hypothetical protein